LPACSSIQGGVAHVLEQFGKIDVLVNNAGLGFNHAAVAVTEQDWMR
jgi:2-deoxy-D-gluconate 3-dehydrogenase